MTPFLYHTNRHLIGQIVLPYPVFPPHSYRAGAAPQGHACEPSDQGPAVAALSHTTVMSPSCFSLHTLQELAAAKYNG